MDNSETSKPANPQPAGKQANHNQRAWLSAHPQSSLLKKEQHPPGNQLPQRKTRLKSLRLPKWWLYALIWIGVAGAIALAFRPAPIAVDLGKVTSGPLQVTVTGEGKTRVKDRFVVAAPVAGRLQRIDKKVGDSVAAGETIAQLDPLPLNSQVSVAQAKLQELQAQMSGVETQRPKSQELLQAEARARSAQAGYQAASAQVAQVEAEWIQAKRDSDRTARLEQQGAVSRRALEAAQTLEKARSKELETARQQLNQAMQAVAAAREEIPLLQSQQRDPDYLLETYRAQIAAVEAELTNLADEASRTTITAPAGGTILRLPEASARFVQPGDTLLEIGDAKDLELVIDVLSTDAVKIQSGSDIIIQQWGGAETLQATVSKIEPAAFTEVSALGVEEQRVNIIGKFTDLEVPLGDGYRIEADIVTWQTKESLQVPVSALFRCELAWCVFIVNNNRAQPKEIEIGPRNPFSAVVTAGLTSGDIVILHPNEKIEENSQIKPR